MSRVLNAADAAVQYSGPPADRMAGRAAARAARAATTKPAGNYTPKQKPAAPAPAPPAAATRVSAATEARANAFLDRESLLDQAVNAGVIGANLRGHYARCFDADPQGTRSYLQSIGLRVSMAQDTQAAPDAYVDTHLSRAERNRIAAARAGGGPRIVNGGL